MQKGVTLFLLLLFHLPEQSDMAGETCQRPPAIYGGYALINRTVQSFDEGKVVTYKCGTGYYRRDGGTDTAVCTVTDGKPFWTKPTMSCGPKSCPAPGSIKNGKVVGTLFQFGESVTYVCDSGYKLSSTRELICLSTGKWSDTTPQCKAISCGKPDPVEHGSVDYTSVVFKSKARYSCDDNYQLIGQSVRKCTSSGFWDGKNVTCQDQSTGFCPNLIKNLPYGEMTISGTGKYDTVIYSCDDGETERVAVCTTGGKWSTGPPTCPVVTRPTTQVMTTKKQATTTTDNPVRPIHVTVTPTKGQDECKSTKGMDDDNSGLNLHPFIFMIFVNIISLAILS